MAFLNRISNLLKLNVCKQVSSVSYAPRPSVFQAIRCMSSSATTNLFVEGLSLSTDDTTLKEAFSQHGTVIEARIIEGRETGRSRGFVTFDTSEAASSAMEAFDGKELQGQNIRVKLATEKPRSGGGREGGGGSYGSCDVSGGSGNGFDFGGQSGGYVREENRDGDGNEGRDVSNSGGGGGGNQFPSGGGEDGSVQGGSKPGFFESLHDDQGLLGGDIGWGGD